MELPINFYNKTHPEKGDIITVFMNKHSDDLVYARIFEYPEFTGIIQISDLSHKKKIKSVKSFVTNKPVPAEVMDVNTEIKMINLTRRYLSKDEEIKYGRYYKDQVKLYNITKTLSNKFSLDIKDCIKNIIYKLYQDSNLDSNCPKIIDFISQNYKNYDFTDFGDYNHMVIQILNETFKPKPKKYNTEFKLVASRNVKDLINFFTELENEFKDAKFTLIHTPVYNIQTFGLDNELDKHKHILEYIKTNSKKHFINYIN